MEEAFGRFLDLLKASGWQVGAIALAAALFLYLGGTGVIPGVEPWMKLVAWTIMLFSGALALAAIGTASHKGARASLVVWHRHRARQKAEQAFRDYIPYLTEKERQILGYLREKKQKTFVADHDGGYAGTLLARGYVTYIGVRGQSFDIDKTPMGVAEHVWKVMEERPADFPYQPEYSDGPGRRVETHPWRIHWMAR
jgi:hypothetical protein